MKYILLPMYFLQKFNSIIKMNKIQQSFSNMLLHLVIYDYESLKFKPSILAIAAISIAIKADTSSQKSTDSLDLDKEIIDLDQWRELLKEDRSNQALRDDITTAIDYMAHHLYQCFKNPKSYSNCIRKFNLVKYNQVSSMCSNLSQLGN